MFVKGRYAPLPFADGDPATVDSVKVDDHTAAAAQNLTKWHIARRMFASLLSAERKVKKFLCAMLMCVCMLVRDHIDVVIFDIFLL